MSDIAARLDPGPGLTEQFVGLPDGRRLRAVTGGGPDGMLVVFEAGMSAPAASWVHTQREISAHTRTLSYDRAGYGGSDPDPQERTLDRIVDDFVALLDGLSETRPVVLVGHSWGGPIIRLFAERYPDRVAGLVFVDATLAEVMTERSGLVAAGFFRVMALVARCGGRGLLMRLTAPHGTSPEISAEELAIMSRDYACAPAMRTGVSEARQIAASLATLRRLQTVGTPDVPTICLQAGRVERGMKKARPLFNAAAQHLMDAAPKGRVVVVDGAGHLLPQENPAAVRDAILETLAAASTVPR